MKKIAIFYKLYLQNFTNKFFIFFINNITVLNKLVYIKRIFLIIKNSLNINNNIFLIVFLFIVHYSYQKFGGNNEYKN